MNRLRDSTGALSSGKISYLQQPAPTNGGDDSGSILDGQSIVIDDTLDQTPDSTVSTSPRQIVENAEENPNADLDDRLAHMLNLGNEPNPPEIITAPVLADEEPGQVTSTVHYTVTTTTTTPTQVNPLLNYHISEFDSSVKHDVYPSPETESMISWGIAFVGSMMLIVYILKFIINLSRNSSYFSMRQYKMKAVYAILRDLAIFVFILAIVLSLHFHSWLDFYETNIENLLYGVYIFILIWIVSSIILLYSCYVQLETFYNYEAISKDISQLQDLKRFYEQEYEEGNDIHPNLIEQIRFQVMRQAFISPIELPILTECFLRRDFNFSMYLGYCITDFLSEIIGFISLYVYIFICMLLGIYRLINVLDVDLGS
jgi:hypothetical protein